jgi:hypothetical protein
MQQHKYHGLLSQSSAAEADCLRTDVSLSLAMSHTCFASMGGAIPPSIRAWLYNSCLIILGWSLHCLERPIMVNV